ncbi:hypothetical protein L9F63_027167, partial [Diploptera punctata]
FGQVQGRRPTKTPTLSEYLWRLNTCFLITKSVFDTGPIYICDKNNAFFVNATRKRKFSSVLSGLIRMQQVTGSFPGEKKVCSVIKHLPIPKAFYNFYLLFLGYIVKKTFLANAFALVSLATIQEFHECPRLP